MKKIMLGNEAIVEGAVEAGVDFVSAYPGTPSSEIGNTFSKIADNIHFEFSTNEKVAIEAMIGASFSGLKCLASMKNFGVNVALDSLIPFTYTGVKGACVIVVADDPSCWSSGQSEENSRGFANFLNIPILEPSDPKEAKEMTKLGFEISEKYKVPVILRITTRVAHQRMPVELAPKKKKTLKKGKFVKNPEQFITLPPRVLEMKEELSQKMEEIRKFSEKSDINLLLKGKGKVGIITSGVSYLHVSEIALNMPLLKIGFFNPIPREKIKRFISKLDKVIVIEELEPYIKREVKIIAKENGIKTKVVGDLPVTGELNAEIIKKAVFKVIGKKEVKIKERKIDLPKRFPRFCPGCPYWLVFSAIKKAAPKETIYGGDIGCYMLSGMPPFKMQDYLFSMGSSIGIGHGIKKVNENKLIAFIGDSTFFHAGIPALINTVFNKSNPLIVVLDNRITAMTGHQPNPGTEEEDSIPFIKIEDIARACGVKNVKTIDPKNVKDLEETVKDFLNKKEPSVIVARHICALLERKINSKK